MSRELESRLERAFADLPEAAPEAEERASRAALAALPQAAPGPARGRRRRGGAAGAAIGALLLVGLRATGTIHLQVGARARADRPASLAPRLLVPPGATGSQPWSTAGSGSRLGAESVSKGCRSPRPDSRRTRSTSVSGSAARSSRWRRPAGSPGLMRQAVQVVGVAWAPDGLRVAYVVHVGKRYELRLIEGDGDHDRLVDRSVRPARPAWRADSLALAYVGAGGHPVVLDLGHDSRRVLGRGCGSASQVAFSLRGNHVAAATDQGLAIDGSCRRGGAAVDALGWLGPADLVTARSRSRAVLERNAAGRARAATPSTACAPGRVEALATWSAANGVAVATTGGAGLQLRALAMHLNSENCRSVRSALLLDLPGARHVTALDVR